MSERRALTGLVWGLKESFLHYLARLPGQRTQTGFGAGRIATGEFFFPLADDSSFDRATLTGSLEFEGLAQLTAHGGMLNVQLINPRLTITEGAATLTVIDRSQTADPDARRELVTLELPTPTTDGETVMWTGAVTRLAATAVPLFNDVYPAGEAFDPLSVRIGA